MRTTLEVDDDILGAAREMARLRGVSLGTVISELARRGLALNRADIARDAVFPHFVVEPDAAPITPEMVRAALDEA